MPRITLKISDTELSLQWEGNAALKGLLEV